MKDTVMGKIYERAPMQKRKIDKFFSECPNAESELSSFLKMVKPFLDRERISLDEIVNSYLEMIDQIIHARLEFVRTGSYPAKSQEVAFTEVYTNKKTMQQYMLGLALSYFLWRHHFQLLSFFREAIRNIPSGKSLLEVGCGHGLFLVELLKRNKTWANVEVVDISLHSIEMTGKMLEAVLPETFGGVVFHNSDIFKFETQNTYDFISVGEVLEHVDDPKKLLTRLATYLAPDGRIFVTTCSNCPAIDHVYHFKTVQEIRDMIIDCGYIVEQEIVAPSERKNMADLEKFKIDISFAAVIKRAICS